MAPPAIAAFAPPHLPGVLALCEAEGWPSLPSDPARALRILTGEHAQAIVALDGDDVIGFAFAILDAGRLDAYLSMFAVASRRRRDGIGRSLIDALFRITGVERMDLLAEPGSEAFYDSFRHRDFRGYRLFPASS
jgi:ribosomal protein S18 acetylase RimI-like enzyme